MTTTQLSPWLSANLPAVANGEIPTDVPAPQGKHSAGRRVRLDALEEVAPAPATTDPARTQVVTLDLERDRRPKRRAVTVEPQPALTTSAALAVSLDAVAQPDVVVTHAIQPIERVVQAQLDQTRLDRTQPDPQPAPPGRRVGSHVARAEDPAPIAAPTTPVGAAADGMWPDLKPSRRTPAWTDAVDHDADLAFEVCRAKDVVQGPVAGLPTGMHSPETWEAPVVRAHRGKRPEQTRGRSRPVLFGLLGLILGLALSGIGLAAAWAVVFHAA